MCDRVINTKGATVHVAESGAGDRGLMLLHYWGAPRDAGVT
jgi:hypothetical protein